MFMGAKLISRDLYIKLVLLGVSSILVFLLGEILVRATRSHVDLFALTGRTIGRNPMADWAFNDA